MFKKIIKTITITSYLVFVIIGGIVIVSSMVPSDLLAKTIELQSYCRFHAYNTNYGILVDYGRCSFQQRLYIVDLNTGDIVMRSLCGHGKGGDSNIFKGEFSNVPDSNCSSLGHYKIGKERRMYNYPINAFELDGLDKTNSNARARAILIHPSIGPRSLGCITMPFLNYKMMAKILRFQNGNTIMWVYE